MLLFQALFCCSFAFTSSSGRPWGSHRRTSSHTRSRSLGLSPLSQVETEEKFRTDDKVLDEKQSKRTIAVESALVVPFSATTAFDAFCDLSKQVDYSPWLSSVTYLNPPEPGMDTKGKDMGETRWTMKYMGVKFSWNSVVSNLDRPRALEWESTSGMKNYGSVNFIPLDKDRTEVTMRMTFVAPRLVAALFRRSSVMANVVQSKIIRTTLVNFRDAVAASEGKTTSLE